MMNERKNEVMDEKVERVKELVKALNEANKAYYSEKKEIMSNLEYDKLYDELESLEQQVGVILSSSPTQQVGAVSETSLKKQVHEVKALSLKKTKEVTDLEDFVKNCRVGILSWKLDGLTIVLTYDKGVLVRAVTRGNGEIGEDVTHNAKVFKNIPLSIPHKGKLVVRGEAIITNTDFNKINEGLDAAEQYKNPRNLASGSVRQLSSDIAKERCLRFIAFRLVREVDGWDDIGISMGLELAFLEQMGFDVVDYVAVTKYSVADAVAAFTKEISNIDYAVDGLVLAQNHTENAAADTSKAAGDALAFKWQDEEVETTLLDVEWAASKTGALTPVAIFEPVEIEGTTVSRASLHNVSILRDLQLGIGDKIMVYKANMIIPQISKNLTRSNDLPIATNCPICGARTEIKQDDQTEVCICPNGKCKAKIIGLLSHFASRDAMNIVGLSEETISLMYKAGIISDFESILTLPNDNDRQMKLKSLPRMGSRAVEKLTTAIEVAKNTTLDRLMYGLSIPLIGRSASKAIVKAYADRKESICKLSKSELVSLDKIGDVLAENYTAYFEDASEWSALYRLCVFEEVAPTGEQSLEGKTFVVTGSVEKYKNRKELQAFIESLDGVVSGSVSKNTDYLINNDSQSNSSKNKKAVSLGVPIITEEEFQSLF